LRQEQRLKLLVEDQNIGQAQMIRKDRRENTLAH